MTDRHAWLVACATAIGAWCAWPLPRAAAIALILLVVLARAPWALGLATVVWASSAGATALAALHAEPRVGSFEGVATLVNDPIPSAYGSRVDVRIEGRRYEARISGTPSSDVAPHLAGERMRVRGQFQPRPMDAPWLDARHIAGRIAIKEITGWSDAPVVYRFANGIRRALGRGAMALPVDQRALYTGLVFGDDRAQTALLADDFRAGGLGHLLAVSGQNVAFALAAAGPLLRRVSYRIRWPVALGVLVLFVAVTRAEPSVLRAAVMAAIATGAVMRGRTASGVRVLSFAVTGLLCVDPLLIRAVGFQLSVAASLGIIVGSRRVAAVLPGPSYLREALGVTIAAQLAVAPISVVVFGGVPLASIPANMLALPAAGPVMVWGLTGGVIAGFLHGPVATALQLPTRLLLWWIVRIAAVAGRTPLGMLRLVHVVALSCVVGLVAAAAVARRADLRIARILRACAVTVGVVTLGSPFLASQYPAAAAGEGARGVWLGRNGAVVVEVDTTASSAEALRSLRERDVGEIDVLVVRNTSATAAAVARDLRSRYEPPVLWAPTRHQIRGASTPLIGEHLDLDGLTIDVVEAEDHVRVVVGGP